MLYREIVTVCSQIHTKHINTLCGQDVELLNVKLVVHIATNGPGSVVGIATSYGLDGTGIESRWGRDFPHLSGPALGPTQLPVQWVPGLSRGQGAAGA
jgi:hypothetical protein